MVRADVPKGKYQGVRTGRIAIRKTGCFGLKRSEGKQIDVNAKYCVMLQRGNGYGYEYRKT